MIARILWIALACYLAYRILFDFIIPVVGTTRKVRKAFDQAREQHEAQMRAHAAQHPGQTQPSRPDPNDYIEFEEIK